MQVGGFVMPPLVLSTLLLWYALGYRMSMLKKSNRGSVRSMIERYRMGQWHHPRSIVEQAVITGIQVVKHPGPHPRRLLDDAFNDYQPGIERFRVLIRAIVTVAPLWGLLGTVDGMIETFDSLRDMQLFSQSGGIAAGISQALFTTQFGLAVAIPGLLVKGFLDRRQQQIEMELAQIKDILCTTAGKLNAV